MNPKKKERNYRRIFFATDLHASEVVFRKFLGAVSFYDVDALIMGGDVFGKTFVPLVEDGSGRFHYGFNGQTFEDVPESQLGKVEDQIANAGDYSRRFTKEEFAELTADPKAAESYFEQAMVERMNHWADLANQHLGASEVKCYWTGGNDDKQELLDRVATNESFVPVEGKVIRLDGERELASLGWSNPTPWKTPRECSEDELAAKLRRLEGAILDPKSCVLNIHPPPYDSNLDMAGKLDQSVFPPRPVTMGGHQVLIPVGSTAVREMIERVQPLLMLCGHIHETRNVANIGRTTCINPGSEHESGYVRGVIINLKEAKLLSYQFTSG